MISAKGTHNGPTNTLCKYKVLAKSFHIYKCQQNIMCKTLAYELHVNMLLLPVTLIGIFSVK